MVDTSINTPVYIDTSKIQSHIHITDSWFKRYISDPANICVGYQSNKATKDFNTYKETEKMKEAEKPRIRKPIEKWICNRKTMTMQKWNCLCGSVECYEPDHILYNDPATIVFWRDGTKTVVKRSPGEPFNAYTAFCAALAKKIFGTNSRVSKIVREGKNQKKMHEGETDVPILGSEIKAWSEEVLKKHGCTDEEVRYIERTGEYPEKLKLDGDHDGDELIRKYERRDQSEPQNGFFADAQNDTKEPAKKSVKPKKGTKKHG